MKLREIAAESFSLEFATYERDQVMERLAGLGAVKVDRQANYDRLHVLVGQADVELLYLDEWDEPCLISSTDAGHSLLQRVIDPIPIDDAPLPPEADIAGDPPPPRRWRRQDD